MKNLFILGTAESGKTALAVGIALKMMEEGYRVSYFKPVASAFNKTREDDDALLMRKVLNIEHPVNVIVPCIAGPSYLSSYKRAESLKNILSSYERIASNSDFIIIGGAGNPHTLASLGLDSATLAEELNAGILFVINIRNDFDLDLAVYNNNYFINKGIKIIGNVFNNVPRPLQAKTEGIYKNVIEENVLKTLGIIPASAGMTFPTVAEYYEILGGEILSGEEHMDRIVEDVIIGAMTLESAMGYMRRAPNKLIITGGDRADLSLAALETSTSALVLTGGFYPDVKVIARAAEKEVPVILVYYDTYTTIEKLNKVSKHIRPDDKLSINIAKENVEKYCDWQYILQELKRN